VPEIAKLVVRFTELAEDDAELTTEDKLATEDKLERPALL
jgi:hypothetical protein